MSDLDGDAGDILVGGEVFAMADDDEVGALEVADGGDGSFEDGLDICIGMCEELNSVIL